MCHGFISHLTYPVQQCLIPWIITEHRAVSNTLFVIKQLNNILFIHKFFQSKYMSDRLITSVRNVVGIPVHARTPSVAVSTG